MLFSEIYGSYYNAVAKILRLAVSGELTDTALYEAVKNSAFSESIAVIPDSLRNETWPLLFDDNSTPIEHSPTMPLTELQKRWLKALLCDPRIKLFSPSAEGLEDVRPLYTPDVFVYFDRYSNGDPFDDPGYISNFQTALAALREKRRLRIGYTSHRGERLTLVCIPKRLEYSQKDDKFRLETIAYNKRFTINLSRVTSCSLLEPCSAEDYRPVPDTKRELIIELTDERNALERVMLHFSDVEKETQKIDERHYRFRMSYYAEDETEMLIRVLSFGPVLRVISPDSFIEQIKNRISRQNELQS